MLMPMAMRGLLWRCGCLSPPALGILTNTHSADGAPTLSLAIRFVDLLGRAVPAAFLAAHRERLAFSLQAGKPTVTAGNHSGDGDGLADLGDWACRR